MLIKDHTTYTECFRNIASNHKLLHHLKNEDGTENLKEKHFARAVISRHPLMAVPDLEEFLKGVAGSGLKFPAMVLIAYTGKYSRNNGEHTRKGFDGEFIILDRVSTEKFDEHEAKFDLTEGIGEDIVSYLGQYYEDRVSEGLFSWGELENEKISIQNKGIVGTKFYFSINVPYGAGILYNGDSFFETLPEE